MSLVPDRMKTVKVVVPLDYTRNLLRFLLKCNDLELIDIQKKPFDLTAFNNGAKIKELSLDFDRMIEDFEIKKKSAKIHPIVIDDSDINVVIQKSEKISQEVISELKKINDRITLAEKELEKTKLVNEVAKNLIPFGFSFSDLEAEKAYFNLIVGRLESKRVPRFCWNLEAVTDGNFVFREAFSEGGFSFIAIGYLERYQEEINRLLVAYGFEKYSIPERIVGDPEKITQKGKEKIKDLEEKLNELMKQVDQIIKEHGAEILGYAEQLHVEENYLKILNMTRKTQKTTTLWGWITQRGIRKFKNTINKSTDNNAIIEFSKPVFEESEFPTKTSVPKILKIFDDLVSGYGIPGYNEYNPAIIFTIFYPIIFGIMFADVGHGLLFTLLGVYGLIIRNKRLDSGSFKDELLNYFKNGAILIIFSGICSMFFGVLFGSYFGLNHTHYEILKPIWFSPESAEPPTYNEQASTVILMLELSLVIGMIHMTVGYILRLLTNLKHKEYKEAIFVTLMAMWLHWGLFILVFTFGTNFMGWFTFKLTEPRAFDLAIISINGKAIAFFYSNSPLIFFLIGFALPLLIMTGYLLTHGLDGMAELLELLLSTLSNTVSYSRIFAMNAVHGALSSIFLLTTFTGEGEPLGVVNYIGLILGALVILVLEGLFSFIQTLRLQWVEFFAKMGYHGTGIKFHPIAMARKYSIAI